MGIFTPFLSLFVWASLIYLLDAWAMKKIKRDRQKALYRQLEERARLQWLIKKWVSMWPKK